MEVEVTAEGTEKVGTRVMRIGVGLYAEVYSLSANLTSVPFYS